MAYTLCVCKITLFVFIDPGIIGLDTFLCSYENKIAKLMKNSIFVNSCPETRIKKFLLGVHTLAMAIGR